MANLQKTLVTGEADSNHISTRFVGKLDAVLVAIDLAMMLAAFLGLSLIVVTVATMAVIDLAKLFAGLWSNQDDRWLVALFGMVAIWVAVRWKQF